MDYNIHDAMQARLLTLKADKQELEVAERMHAVAVQQVLEHVAFNASHGADSAIIDLDRSVETPEQLESVANVLRARGFSVSLYFPQNMGWQWDYNWFARTFLRKPSSGFYRIYVGWFGGAGNF